MKSCLLCSEEIRGSGKNIVVAHAQQKPTMYYEAIISVKNAERKFLLGEVIVRIIVV